MWNRRDILYANLTGAPTVLTGDVSANMIAKEYHENAGVGGDGVAYSESLSQLPSPRNYLSWDMTF